MMPRRREDSEDLAPPAKGGWLWPALCGLLLGLAIGSFSGFIIALAVRDRPAGQGQTQQLTVPQLRDLVVGKTPDEVIAAVGRPGATSEEGEWSGQEWRYFHRFIDPISQKPTAWTTLLFTKGKTPVVESVR
jgi:hypothetical protein